MGTNPTFIFSSFHCNKYLCRSFDDLIQVNFDPTRTKTRMPRVKVKMAKKVKKKAQYTGGVTKGSKGVVPENI